MIPKKEKPCSGKGLAKGSGCNQPGFHNSMQKGLCSDCWPKWLLETEEGKTYLDRVSLKANKQVIHRKSQVKTTAKRELMSVDAYRAKVLQPVINEIVRLIDYEQPCIASGVARGKFSAGHFTSVGSNRLIAMNLHNIHIQAFHSNGPQGGQPIEYLQGLKDVYSIGYSKFVVGLRRFKRIQKFNKNELVEAYEKAKPIRLELRKDKRIRSAKERIELRNEINQRIGLYPNSIYQLKSTNNERLYCK